MKVLFRNIVLIIIFLLPSLSYSWGMEGHRVIAKIASDHLNSKTKDGVFSILGFKNLAMISNVADEDYRGRYPHTHKWHYSNETKDKVLNWSKGQSVKNISHAIQYEVTVLKDLKSSKGEKKIALTWLVHLVGDAHQPFHAGHERDRGGNLCYVRWYNKIISLHKLWDTKLIESLKLSYSEYADWIEEKLDYQYSPAFADDNVKHWLREGRALLGPLYPNKRQGHDFCKVDIKSKLTRKQKKSLPFITAAYRARNQDVLDQQLHLAGRRLASMLNAIDF